MIQRALLIAALAAALQLHAATTYRVEIEATAANDSTRPARVTADGDRIRIDYAAVEGPVALDAQYSIDGGKSYIGLNSGLKTWFPNKDLKVAPLTPEPARPNFHTKARKVKWSWREEPAAEPGLHTYIGTLSYNGEEEMYGGSRVSSRRTADVEIRTSEAIDARWPGYLPLRIGIAEVDAQLAASGASIKGFPVRISFTSTQQYDRGPLLKDQRTMTVRDVATVKSLDPHLFAVPQGYREQPPIIATPGVVSR